MGFKDALMLNNVTTVSLGGANNPTEIQGFYLGSKKTPDQGYGEGLLHFFQLENGETVGVWGKTVLNRVFEDNNFVGQMVKVEFTGMIPPKTKGRRPAYGFRVQHDEDQKIDVSGINLGSTIENEGDADNDEVDNQDNEMDTVTPQKATRPAVAARLPSNDAVAKAKALLQKKHA